MRNIIAFITAVFFVLTILPTSSSAETYNTSKLGHLRSENVRIYKEIGNSKTSFTAKGLTNSVYYIKKEAKEHNNTYYLISKQPSSENGVVGWVNAKDVDVRSHVGVDMKQQTLYVKGIGHAYSKAWGGTKDIVYNDLTKYKNHVFYVNKTEKVGNNIWYRGILDGKQVFLHSNWVNTLKESSTSKLGHFKNEKVQIFKRIGEYNTTFTASGLTNSVYYIKKEASLDGQTFYLMSRQPSSENGVVGWVNAEDVDVRSHVGVDMKQQTLYVKGIGHAYSKAWGGTKDIVYNDLTKYKNHIFYVNKTEKVGNNIWYRGILDGKQVFLHSNWVVKPNEPSIKYTSYNISLTKAVEIQMKASPQTDKYRNEPAYISSDFVKIYEGGSITESGVRLRTSPKLDSNNNIYTTVDKGTAFLVLDKNVKGDTYSGSSVWYKIRYNNKDLYVHSSLATINSKIAEVTGDLVNVRADRSLNSHIYGQVKKGQLLTVLELGAQWHKISYNTWRNATYSDVKYYLDPSNFKNDEKQRYQFLDLSKPSGATVDQLNRFLNGKGDLQGMGQAFVDAANKNNINDLYLISHAILETGNGKSAKFVYNGKIVYNMYGIGAVDSNPYNGAAKTAYENDWTTPYKAIVGGAAFIGNKYIKAGQNTLYKMRWNPEAMDKLGYATHQYATDIGWAYKQVNNIYKLYEEIGVNTLILDIPVYK
ncbi:N-acetylglucosaminidase [Aeribacillus sp. FSL W8-0870]|uniref:N-acetylglucosaminidase n=1 Tax=Aeribacillus sp. FSL W8-0870 TaxID=2954706 RepID=UPI0030CC4ECA